MKLPRDLSAADLEQALRAFSTIGSSGSLVNRPGFPRALLS
jgi:hypothetical protein